MPVESISGRGATRNANPTRFNLKERIADGDALKRALRDELRMLLEPLERREDARMLDRRGHEVAAALRKPEGTVKRMLHDARHRLHGWLEEGR